MPPVKRANIHADASLQEHPIYRGKRKLMWDITHPHRHKYNTVTESSSGDFQHLMYRQRETPYSERLLEAKEVQTMEVEACSVGQFILTILTPLIPLRFPAG